jgi:RimJ/RimL family protein N-acetyltransferase
VRLDYPREDLTDGVVLLRRWDDADLGCVREATTDPRIPEWTTVPVAFTAEEGLAFIRRQWGRANSGEGLSFALADAASGEAVGLVVLLLEPRRPGVAETGYWVIPRARGRGLATRAVRLASAWALGDAGLARIQALVEPENEASQRVLRAAGFQSEGVLRSYLGTGGRRADAVVFSRITHDL